MGSFNLFLFLALIVSLAFPQLVVADDLFPVDQHGDHIRDFIDKIDLSRKAAHEEDVSLSLALKFREVLNAPAESRHVNASEFLGFVEGRARVEIPQWWRSRVLSMAGSSEAIYFPSPEAQDGQTLWTESGTRRFAGVDDLVEEEGGMRFQFGSRKFLLTHDTIAKVFPDNANDFFSMTPWVACFRTDDEVVIADDSAIICVDTATERPKWARHFIENLSQCAGRSGPDDPYWQVRVHNSRVVEFVGWPDSMTFRVLDLKTGATIVRFNSLYAWSKPKEQRR